jgi:hypothetical protein
LGGAHETSTVRTSHPLPSIALAKSAPEPLLVARELVASKPVLVLIELTGSALRTPRAYTVIPERVLVVIGQH